MGIRQGFYNHSAEFVAVRNHRISPSLTLKPGDKVDKKVIRQFHMMSLFRRRLIGVKGSEWAKAMINKSKGHSVLIPEVNADKLKTVPEKPVKKVIKPKVTKDAVKGSQKGDSGDGGVHTETSKKADSEHPRKPSGSNTKSDKLGGK